MTSPTPIAPTATPAPAEARTKRLRGLSRHLKLIAGLLAIYGPVALVFMTQRGPLGKAYLVLAIWAVEGILWYWLDGRARPPAGAGRRRAEHQGPLTACERARATSRLYRSS